MDQIAEFSKAGYLIDEFKNTEELKKINNLLTNIRDGKLKKNYTLETKYHNTWDLRPSAYDYDDTIIKILKQNNIPEILDNITQRNMVLGHVQIRVSNPGNSYMPWHRDTFSSDQKNHGMFPPPIKLIYYLPESDSESKLELLEGSHNLIVHNLHTSQFINAGLSNFDTQLFNICKKINYSNVSNNFIIFDTSCLHNAVKSEKKSIRIIYSFNTEKIISKTFTSDHHKELLKFYKEIK